MPRFFFDIDDGGGVTDREGVVFTDLAHARAEGIATAGEILRQDGKDLPLGAVWKMTISDERGSVVCTLRFTTSE